LQPKHPFHSFSWLCLQIARPSPHPTFHGLPSTVWDDAWVAKWHDKGEYYWRFWNENGRIFCVPALKMAVHSLVKRGDR
jgi:hypothetical protein